VLNLFVVVGNVGTVLILLIGVVWMVEVFGMVLDLYVVGLVI